MKKLLIMLLIASLVLIVGCGKDNDAVNEDSAPQQQQEQQEQQEQQPTETQEKEEPISEEAQKAKEVTSVDITDMESEDMDKLVEMFNSEDSTPEQKEAARIQLEELFKQAEAQQ